MAIAERELVDKTVEAALYQYGEKTDPQTLGAFKKKYWSKNNNTNDVRSMTYDMLLDFTHFYEISLKEALRIAGIDFPDLEGEEAAFLDLAEKVDEAVLPHIEASLKRILPECWEETVSLTPTKRVMEYIDRSTIPRRRHFQNQSLQTAWEDRTASTTLGTKDLPEIVRELNLTLSWILNTREPTGLYTDNSQVERILNLFILLQPYAKKTLLEALKAIQEVG
ncbi:hypothetical protein ACKQTC_07230 [Peptococcus simiae]|uniref:Uncharacterized protein n=1 Tax=Peptococcus simiae TaxID=1643805 RepID=A0ABW9H186_9FIRM